MSSNLTFIKNIELPTYFFNNSFKTKYFLKFPFFSFNNGTPCLALNSYIQSNEIIKLSYATLLKISYSLTHIISFCEKNKIKLYNFSENDLIAFSHTLQNKERTNRTVIFILINTLKFFNYLGNTFLDIKNYCIDILHCSYKKQKSNSNSLDSLYHICFPTKEIAKSRSPISSKNIEKMYDAVDKISDSSFVRKRNRVILKLLEVTGARVGEIALLKIEDIYNIFNMEKPTLKIRTLKRRGDIVDYRYIPVNKVDFNEVETYIKIYRNKIIKKTVGKSNDEGFLLINEKTGESILAITITNEIAKIRNAAGIKEKACAHMFRHRFITNLFINLIKQYDIQNKDQFRNNLMDLENLKVYVQQATGHKNLSSLDDYIDIAKSELTNMKEVIQIVLDNQKIDTIKKEKNKLLNMLKKNEISTEQYIFEIEKINIMEK